jgi:hypothetical protein
MSLRRFSLVVPALAMLAAACGSDALGPADITQTDLQGNWKVTSYEYVKDGDTGKHFDLVKDGDYTINAIVQANGAYTLTFNHAGVPTTNETGVLTVANSAVTLARSGQAAQPLNTLSLEGKTLTFTDESASYDFGNTGTVQAADLHVTWEKQ